MIANFLWGEWRNEPKKIIIEILKDSTVRSLKNEIDKLNEENDRERQRSNDTMRSYHSELDMSNNLRFENEKLTRDITELIKQNAELIKAYGTRKR